MSTARYVKCLLNSIPKYSCRVRAYVSLSRPYPQILNQRQERKNSEARAMLRVAHIPPVPSPALVALKLSLIPTVNFTSPSTIRKFSSVLSLHAFLPKTFLPNSPYPLSLNLRRFPPRMAPPSPRGKPLCFSALFVV